MSLADPSALHDLADRISRHAAAVRETARLLRMATSSADWRGRAADAFALSAQRVVSAYAGSADQLDQAAALLHRHANTVHNRLDTLAKLASAADSLLADAVHVAEGLL